MTIKTLGVGAALALLVALASSPVLLWLHQEVPDEERQWLSDREPGER